MTSMRCFLGRGREAVPRVATGEEMIDKRGEGDEMAGWWKILPWPLLRKKELTSDLQEGDAFIILGQCNVQRAAGNRGGREKGGGWLQISGAARVAR
jgi:hypothetical protein